MAMPTTKTDRDFQKFEETPEGKTAVRVIPLQKFSPPSETDNIQFSYPNATTEVIEYMQALVVLRTVTIVYTDASKADIDSVTVS